MFAYSTVKQNIIDSLSKKIFWAFDIVTGGGTYYWAMVTRSYGGQSYTFKIIPESFAGIRLNRGRSELDLQSPSTLEFDVLNPNNALSASTFEGAELVIKLIMSDYTNEAVIRQWRFNVKRVDPKIQKLHFYCEDYIQKYIYGDYPNTKLIKDLFPSEDTVSDDNVCIPEPYGTAYVPLRSVYVSTFINYTSTTISAKASSNGTRCRLEDVSSGLNIFEIGRNLTISGFTSTANNQVAIVLNKSATMLEFSESEGIVTEVAGDSITLTQGSRAYLLGSTHNTFTVSRVRSPREWGRKSEWYSSAYTMSQGIKINASSSRYRTLQPIIHDVNNDGTADSPGLWRSGENFIDMPARFSRSDTVNMTNPADVIKQVLENMGVSSTQLKNSTSLIVYWSFDEGTGTDVYDGSGNDNNLTLNTSSMWSSTGKVSNSVLSDSIAKYGGCVLSTYPTSQITVSCWIKLTQMSTVTNTLFNYTYSSQYIGSWALYTSTNNIIFGVRNTTKFISSIKSKDLVDGNWHHIVGTYNGSIARVYVDTTSGVVSTSGSIALLQSTKLVRISWPGSTNHLNGNIDEVRIYNKALSSTEIEELYYNYKMEGWWETARNTYHQQGISFNGAFWFKETRTKKLSKLLNMCNSMINSEDLIELLPITNDSQKTITNADIITEDDENSESTFDYNYIQEEVSDCGYVAWQLSNNAQDQFLQILVSAKSSITKISNEVFEIPFIQDEQIAQKLGSIYYQLKLLKKAEISYTSKIKLIGLKVGQFITINHADYGGNYLVLVDSILVKKDGSIEFVCIKFSDTIDDIEDIAFSTITVNEDDLDAKVWEPVISGPLTEEDIGKAAFQVWGRPYLIVSKNINRGDHTSIQSALNALGDNGYEGIYILNGIYENLTEPITIPNRNITITGESLDGVIVNSTLNDNVFRLINISNTIKFNNFTITQSTKVTASAKACIYSFTGTSTSRHIIIDEMNFNIAKNNYGVFEGVNYGITDIRNNNLNGGNMGVRISGLDNLQINNNKFVNQQYGMYIVGNSTSSSVLINNNIFNKIVFFGIHVIKTNKLDINSNTICLTTNSTAANLYGIYLYECKKIKIISNTIDINDNSTGTQLCYGVFAGWASSDNKLKNFIINNNIVTINRNKDRSDYGIYLIGIDGQICNNNIEINNPSTNTSYYRNGIFININIVSTADTRSLRNVIQGNNIDLINNTARDRGIVLNTSCNQNQGGDNITYNCGVSVLDSGSSNAVTAKDV